MHKHTHRREKCGGKGGKAERAHMHMEFTYQRSLFFVKLNGLNETMPEAPATPSFCSCPVVALTNPFFFSACRKKQSRQGPRAQENSEQENACLPINEICANVQESARNLAKGQKPKGAREAAQKVAYKSNVLGEKTHAKKKFIKTKTNTKAGSHTHS